MLWWLRHHRRPRTSFANSWCCRILELNMSQVLIFTYWQKGLILCGYLCTSKTASCSIKKISICIFEVLNFIHKTALLGHSLLLTAILLTNGCPDSSPLRRRRGACASLIYLTLAFFSLWSFQLNVFSCNLLTTLWHIELIGLNVDWRVLIVQYMLMYAMVVPMYCHFNRWLRSCIASQDTCTMFACLCLIVFH